MVEIERQEKRILYALIIVAVVVNVVTISPIIPWQGWLFWSKPVPTSTFAITICDYKFTLPPGGISVKVGEPVKFVVTSCDVTYGFGVFHKTGRMLFQIQVLPGYSNEIVWIFDEAGPYTIRSTEYSGPSHPFMVVPNAITVVQ